MAAVSGAPRAALERVTDPTKAVDVPAAEGGDSAGTSVLLARLSNGALHAVPNACSHYKLPLTKAVLSGNRLVCPFHGATFDVRTGDIEDGPGLDCLQPVRVSEHGGGISVQLSAYEARGAARFRKPTMRAPSAADDRHFVVVGGGAAGGAAVESIRASGFGGRITVLSKDDLGVDPLGPGGSGAVPFVDRTVLSKNPSAARGSATSRGEAGGAAVDEAGGASSEGTDADAYSGVGLRSADFYRDLGVELRCGAAGEVVSLDPLARRVECRDGSQLSYDRVLCATSGPAARVPGTEGDWEGVFTVRTPADARGLDEAIGGAAEGGRPARVVVIGASFIGMEVAAYVAKTYMGSTGSDGVEGKKVESVTVCGRSPEAFERSLGPVMGGCLRRVLEDRGVQFRLGRERGTLQGIVATKPDEDVSASNASGDSAPGHRPRVSGVRLGPSKEASEELPADIVLLGAGIVAEAPYLDNDACRKAGVELFSRHRGGGVKVDAGLRAARHLFVAGDLARFPYPHAGPPVKPGEDEAAAEGSEEAGGAASEGEDSVRIEHWDVAVDQGRVAGRAMVGQEATYDGVPFFWTGLLGKNVRFAGHAPRWEELIVLGDPSRGPEARLTQFYVSGGRVLAVATLQDDPNAVAAKEMIRVRTASGYSLDLFPAVEDLRAARDAGRRIDLRALLQRGAAGPS